MTWELSDLLRAIATTIVIGIHASHHWWFGINDLTSINPEIFISTLINQVGRWTVPMFVILSGFALAKSEEKRPFDLKIFFQRRLWRIVPPYFLFTMLNVIGRSQFLAADWSGQLTQIWQAIATGMGDYHLYFLGIIMQCYLAYPCLRRINFTPSRLSILLILTFALFSLRWISATFGYLPNIINFLPDGNHVIYWLSYFQIGIWLATDNNWTNQLVSKWRSRSWGYIFAIAAIIELSEFYWLAISKNLVEAIGHYTRPSVVLMSLSFLLWAISWQSWQIKSFPVFIQKLFQLIQPQIKTFSKVSFITYLIHVWILRAIAPLEIFGGVLFMSLAVTLSWLISINLWRFLNHKATPVA